MKASELRIGNVIKHPYLEDGEFEIVSSIKPSQALNTKWEVNEEHPDFFTGIPITEEWLLKFGFEMIEDTNIWNKYPVMINIEQTNGGFIYDGWHIKTVHQLQNLWNSITLAELEIKK